jgi:hypothetical protein
MLLSIHEQHPNDDAVEHADGRHRQDAQSEILLQPGS